MYLLAAVLPQSVQLAGVGMLVLALAGALPLHADASQPVAPASTSAAPASAASRAQPARPSSPPRVVRSTRPAWNELDSTQQQALVPLAAVWPTLSEAQKRKWLALSGNFQKLSPDEQSKLHSRMADWVALSPQQRTQARLNFGETKSLAADDKKAKWEAYQALPPEEKRRLAAGSQARTPPTAAAVTPVPAQKLTTVPKASREASRESRPPRIASAPIAGQVPAAPALNPPQQN